ncbi:hypothetical protein A5719_10350 [Mycolicibacterium peregrinum]|uniref:hypothetical protein n=1 Tax=Mycolicibacterium peregrinum TaxID=43304 RepID=UPI0007EA18C4|nr:hypothetical protein [Mycolicibacterium peregrinum]OBF42835.1 hypothetical protein A5719_10350 [Mycolicibacterium peregrinum]
MSAPTVTDRFRAAMLAAGVAAAATVAIAMPSAAAPQDASTAVPAVDYSGTSWTYADVAAATTGTDHAQGRYRPNTATDLSDLMLDGAQ